MFYKFPIKRFCDLFFSIVFLIILSPLLIFVGFINFIFQGRPIFFKQKRPGYRGKIFTLIKFRTMKLANDSLTNDEKRLTSFGRFLRKTSLDELPSLINILKGELSFVGPRPLLMKYIPRYSKYQIKRHDVKPGLTGLAQINGRNLVSWDERLNYDVYYVNNQSFLLDLKILLLTFIVILKREGISPNGSEIMPEFNPKRID